MQLCGSCFLFKQTKNVQVLDIIATQVQENKLKCDILCEYSLQAHTFTTSSSFVTSNLWNRLGTENQFWCVAPWSALLLLLAPAFSAQCRERLRSNSGAGWRKDSLGDSPVQRKWGETRVGNRKCPFNVWKLSSQVQKTRRSPVGGSSWLLLEVSNWGP